MKWKMLHTRYANTVWRKKIFKNPSWYNWFAEEYQWSSNYTPAIYQTIGGLQAENQFVYRSENGLIFEIQR